LATLRVVGVSALSRLLVRIEPAYGAAVTVPAPSDLRFSTVIPGGYDQLSATIPWPLSEPTPPQITGTPTVQVVDQVTGQIVWHGRIADPGLAVKPGQTGYAVTAVGERAQLDGQRAAYALVDRDLASWQPLNDLPSGSTATGTDSGTIAASAQDWSPDTPTSYLEVTIPTSTALTTNAKSTWVYVPAANNPDAAASVLQVIGSSKTSTHSFGSSWITEVYAGPTIVAATTKLAGFTNTSGTQVDWQAMEGYTGGGGTWPTTLDARALLIVSKYTGGGTTTTADSWQRHANIAVHCRRYTRTGAAIKPTSGTPKDFQLTVADILNDCMGRLLLDVVEPAAILEQPDTLVDQAAWWDGISASEVLSFIATYAPNNWWAVWEPGDSGRPRFTYESWLGPVRYVITAGLGRVKLAGGAEQLANAALVIYQAGENTVASTTATVTVPLLDAENITRWVTVDLKDRGTITAAKAQELGQNALTRLAVRKPSGTVEISEPVFDRVQGRVVQPWEIVPGSPVQVIDATTRLVPDYLDTTDGASIFRLTGVQFNASTGTAQLDLDGGSRTLVSRVKVAAAPVRFDAAVPQVGR
jgi:hypothetical protein